MRILRTAAILAGLATAVPAWAGPSVYRTAPDDPRAITVRAAGDGIADDSAAIQKALDAASNRGAGGLVFLPSGRYAISRTIYVWPGVRLLGVGPTRPRAAARVRRCEAGAGGGVAARGAHGRCAGGASMFPR